MLPHSLKRRLLQELPLQANYSGSVLGTAATVTLFTISGGPILITSIFGLVTTAMDGTACNLSLSANPTDFAASDIAQATAIASDLVGQIYTPGATRAASFSVLGATGVGFALMPNGIYVSPGIITMTNSGTQVGIIDWYMKWVQLAPASAVLVA